MNKNIIINQRVERRIALPYPGEVFVQVGDSVEPDTVLARTELLVTLPGYFNICRELGIPCNQESVTNAIKYQIGEWVEVGDVLASTDELQVKAPFRGRIEHISYSNGYLLLRQNVIKDEESLIINASEALGISNRALGNVTNVKIGQHVVRGQVVAGDTNSVKTPMAGIVEEISKENGTITIKPYYEPTEIRASTYGKVIEVLPEYGVVISTIADIITGAYGVGLEVTGKLVFGHSNSDEPVIRVFSDQINSETLENCLKTNTVAIIAPAVDAKVLVDFYGDTVSDGVTGSETIGCSLVIINGFGNSSLDEQTVELLSKYQGVNISVHPNTNIQTPAKKPKIYMYYSN